MEAIFAISVLLAGLVFLFGLFALIFLRGRRLRGLKVMGGSMAFVFVSAIAAAFVMPSDEPSEEELTSAQDEEQELPAPAASDEADDVPTDGHDDQQLSEAAIADPAVESPGANGEKDADGAEARREGAELEADRRDEDDTSATPVDSKPREWFADRSDLNFVESDDPAVRLLETDPENPVTVYIRDMRIGVTRYLLCPEPRPILDARLPLASGDFVALEIAATGHGCLLAVDGWGYVDAVHVNNLVAVEFPWLAGNDFDTGAEVELEDSGRVYWVEEVQVGTLGDNHRLRPFIRAAFD